MIRFFITCAGASPRPRGGAALRAGVSRLYPYLGYIRNDAIVLIITKGKRGRPRNQKTPERMRQYRTNNPTISIVGTLIRRKYWGNRSYGERKAFVD